MIKDYYEKPKTCLDIGLNFFLFQEYFYYFIMYFNFLLFFISS